MFVFPEEHIKEKKKDKTNNNNKNPNHTVTQSSV